MKIKECTKKGVVWAIAQIAKKTASMEANTACPLCCFAIIFFLAPVENANKHLEQVEYLVYRRRTRMILLLEGSLYAAAVIFNWKELVTVITIVFFIVGISLLIGRIKLWKHKQIY